MSLEETAAVQRAIGLSDDTEATEFDGYLLDADSDLTPWITVVMPTLNEEEGVAECIRRATSAIEELGVPSEIIVSDSSTDRTPEIAAEKGAIVVEPEETGYGAAYRYAFERARGQYIVMGDADCTYDFEVFPDLLQPIVLGEADIVMGDRLSGEIETGAMPPLHRYVGNPLLTAFLNMFYDAGVSDAHSGFRVFRRDVLDQLTLQSNGMEFASEMVMEASSKGFTIEEIPISYRARSGEAKLNSFEDGWRHVKFMLLNAPSYLFSVPGAILAALGMTVMSIAFFNISISGIGLGFHAMIAGSLMTIVGYQVGSMGVFATVAGDPIRRPTDRVTGALLEHVTLERGATIGLVVTALGGMYAALLVYQWVGNGFGPLPFYLGDVIAFTAIVLGLQTVFGSFFMSALASYR